MEKHSEKDFLVDKVVYAMGQREDFAFVFDGQKERWLQLITHALDKDRKNREQGDSSMILVSDSRTARLFKNQIKEMSLPGISDSLASIVGGKSLKRQKAKMKKDVSLFIGVSGLVIDLLETDKRLFKRVSRLIFFDLKEYVERKIFGYIKDIQTQIDKTMGIQILLVSGQSFQFIKEVYKNFEGRKYNLITEGYDQKKLKEIAHYKLKYTHKQEKEGVINNLFNLYYQKGQTVYINMPQDVNNQATIQMIIKSLLKNCQIDLRLDNRVVYKDSNKNQYSLYTLSDNSSDKKQDSKLFINYDFQSTASSLKDILERLDESYFFFTLYSQSQEKVFHDLKRVYNLDAKELDYQCPSDQQTDTKLFNSLDSFLMDLEAIPKEELAKYNDLANYITNHENSEELILNTLELLLSYRAENKDKLQKDLEEPCHSLSVIDHHKSLDAELKPFVEKADIYPDKVKVGEKILTLYYCLKEDRDHAFKLISSRKFGGKTLDLKLN